MTSPGFRSDNVLIGLGLVVLFLMTSCRDPHVESGQITSATEILIVPPQPLSVSPDSSLLLRRVRSASDVSLQVVRRSDEQVIASFNTGRPQAPFAPTWAPDGESIALVLFDQGAFHLRIWDLDTGEITTPNAPPFQYIPLLQWARGGTSLLIAVRGSSAGHSRDLYWIDPSGHEEPVLLASNVSRYPTPSLSPDGERIALVFASRPDDLVLLSTGQTEPRTVSIPMGDAPEYRTARWSAGGDSLLIAIRRKGQEYFGIEELSLGTGEVREVARIEADLLSAFYHPEGRFRFVADLDGLYRTQICGPDECIWIGPEGQGSSIAWMDSETDHALVIVTSPTAPPALYETSLASGVLSPVYRPSHTVHVPAPGGVRLPVRSRDGLEIPAYHWAAERTGTRPPAVLIHVPGGPGFQAVPLWEPYIAYLVSQGVDVVYVNYRGQTGYGASFQNAPGGIEARAEDVAEVYDYVLEEMGIAPERVVLYGHSYGAGVVGHAAHRVRLESPIILASVMEAGVPRVAPAERCIIAFHGEDDTLWSPEGARDQIRRFFGRRALNEPCGHFRLLPGEWHIFEGAASFAEIFTSAIAAIDFEETGAAR